MTCVTVKASTTLAATLRAPARRWPPLSLNCGTGRTHVSAGNTLTIQSGGDTSLNGAVASGHRVVAEVGGDLNISSQQDTATYRAKSASSGGSLAFGGGQAGGSISGGQTAINSDYASVNETSALRAGDGGFDVQVKGDTTLSGGQITSTETAVQSGANRFEPGGQVAMLDVNNTSEYKADGASVNIGAGSMKGASSAGIGSDSGNAASVTTSGISGIAGNTAVRTGDAESGIANTFDRTQVQNEVDAQVQITAAFGQQASRAVGDYAATQMEQATKLLQQANETTDPAQQDLLKQQAQALINDWGDNGSKRVALHAIIGGLTGGAAGAAGATAGTLSAPAIAEALQSKGLDPQSALGQTLTGLASTAVGAATGGGAGAATAFNEVNNNFLSHAESSKRLKLQADLLACKDDACRSETQTQINALNQLDAWRDQQIGAACVSPASAACQAWNDAIQAASQSYSGQYSNAIDVAERASVLNQAAKYQAAVNNPFLHGVGKGLLKLTPPGLVVGAAGGAAAMISNIADNGLTQTAIEVGKSIVDLPADLKARLNSNDPTVQGEALVDLVSLGMGGAAVTAGGAKLTVSAIQKTEITAALSKAQSVLDKTAENALLRSGGVIDNAGVPLLDMSKLTNQQKGVMGDLFGTSSVKQIVPDGQKIARIPGVGEQGLDDLYKVNRPDVDYVSIEYKFVGQDSKTGAQVLGNTADGKQGSASWIGGSGRIEKAAGADQAIDVDKALRTGRLESWVVTIRPDGSTAVQVLDVLGKPKPIDTSKIIFPHLNISGAQK